MSASRGGARVLLVGGAAALLVVAVVTGAAAAAAREAGGDGVRASVVAARAPDDTLVRASVLRGRLLVQSHGCAGCHGGTNPESRNFLVGAQSLRDEFQIGECSFDKPKAKPCFRTRPRNLTPDNVTGLGRFSERQIFNALRYGLRPGETPDVEITSSTPGEGNFPKMPKYLAPPMPWPDWRHMSDQELRDVAAYLKRGVKPVRNLVKDSEGPPDFWASAYTVERIGRWPLPPFPVGGEREPVAPASGTAQAARVP